MQGKNSRNQTVMIVRMEARGLANTIQKGFSSPNPGYLQRTQVHLSLQEALEKPVTTVIAGAGYGKTQVTYAFLQEYDATTMWLQLSMFDNLPLKLWDNLIQAVSLQHKDLASSLLSLGFPETAASYYRFLQIFSREIKQGKKQVLVFDDSHLIREKAVLLFFEQLIEAQIPNLSLVFISRNELGFDTVRLLSKGLLSRITEDELRFSKQEMIDYLRLQNLSVSPKAVADIYASTDGWAFAIHLVALSLKNDFTTEEYALFAAKENIFRLLESEVFSVVPKNMQTSLIKLSLLDQIPSKLLKELFPNTDMLAAEIEKIGSFIRYDAFSNVYRIHHLFLSFLAEKQGVLKEADKKAIYLKAANWCAENGNRTNAVVYYAKAHDYDSLHSLALTFEVYFSQEVADFLLQIMKGIPQEKFERHSHLVLLYARLLLSKRQVAEAAAMMQALIRKHEALPETEERNSILSDAYILLGGVGTLSYLNHVNDFSLPYKKAYAYRPSGSEMVNENMSYNGGAYAYPVGTHKEGAFDAYFTVSSEASFYVRKTCNGCARGAADLSRGEHAFFQKDLDSAKKNIHAAIALAQEWKQYHIENTSWFYMIRMHIFTGSYSKLEQTLELFQKRVHEQNKTDGYALFDLASGWAFSMLGQYDKVPAWLKDSMGMSWTESLTLADRDVLVRARYYLSIKEYAKLLMLLESHEDSILYAYLFGQIEMTLLKAVALCYTKHRDEAVKMLEVAYGLAQPNGFDMPFVEHGNHMRTLIRVAMNKEDHAIPKEWLELTHNNAISYAKKLRYVANAYATAHIDKEKKDFGLSKRESEILSSLCFGLARKEIAFELGLSENTVKSIIKNIYVKLNANNALDAVRIATSRGLIE